jgi:hypothetical protein
MGNWHAECTHPITLVFAEMRYNLDVNLRATACIPPEHELLSGIYRAGRTVITYTCVQNRRDVLNSAPTGTEGALRLLSAACARAQFSGCSSTTNAHSETRQMAVCCQNLPLGTLNSHSAPSVLVGVLFKKFGLFLNTHCTLSFFVYRPVLKNNVTLYGMVPSFR